MTPRMLAYWLARRKAELIDKPTLQLYLKWMRPKDVKRAAPRLSTVRR